MGRLDPVAGAGGVHTPLLMPIVCRLNFFIAGGLPILLADCLCQRRLAPAMFCFPREAAAVKFRHRQTHPTHTKHPGIFPRCPPHR